MLRHILCTLWCNNRWEHRVSALSVTISGMSCRSYDSLCLSLSLSLSLHSLYHLSELLQLYVINRSMCSSKRMTPPPGNLYWACPSLGSLRQIQLSDNQTRVQYVQNLFEGKLLHQHSISIQNLSQDVHCNVFFLSLWNSLWSFPRKHRKVITF